MGGGELHLLRGYAWGLIRCSQGLLAVFKIFNDREQQGSTPNQDESPASHRPLEKGILLATF